MKARNQSELLGRTLDEVDFSVIDVETTGLSVERGDRVCEIGIVRLRGGAVIETYSSLINPQRPISAGAYAVNGISPSMVAGAPIFADIADNVHALIEGAVLAAYNAPFDLSFIDYEFRISGYPSVKNSVVDVLLLARQLLPGLGRFPQENVARAVGISNPGRHRALEDALVTAQLLTLFTSLLKVHDCYTIADLQRRDLGQVLSAKRWKIITEAIEARKNVWIRYLTNAEIIEDILTPVTITENNSSYQSAFYLRAYCHSAGTDKRFRLDQILDVRQLEP
jgi:DNA polymerase III epsilon subunit family exonuclease